MLVIICILALGILKGIIDAAKQYKEDSFRKSLGGLPEGKEVAKDVAGGADQEV